MVFNWSLSDSKSLQVSRTLLNILADLNNAVIWMVSPRPFIFKSVSSLTKPFMAVPSVPISIGITVTFMLPSFFQYSSKVLVLISLFAFFQFYLVFSRSVKVNYSAEPGFFFWFFFTVIYLYLKFPKIFERLIF